MYYYPHWLATAEDGTSLPTRPDERGILVIAVPGNPESVRLDFVEPGRVFAASAASLISWSLILAGLLFLSAKKRLPGIGRRGEESELSERCRSTV
jgi:hypothetical protein